MGVWSVSQFIRAALVEYSTVAGFKFFISFSQRALYFNFALGPMNYVVDQDGVVSWRQLGGLD